MNAYYTHEIYTNARGTHQIDSLVIEGDDRAELCAEFIAELYAIEQGHPLHTYNGKGSWNLDTDHSLIDIPGDLHLSKVMRWMDNAIAALGITMSPAVTTR